MSSYDQRCRTTGHFLLPLPNSPIQGCKIFTTATGTLLSVPRTCIGWRISGLPRGRLEAVTICCMPMNNNHYTNSPSPETHSCVLHASSQQDASDRKHGPVHWSQNRSQHRRPKGLVGQKKGGTHGLRPEPSTWEQFANHVSYRGGTDQRASISHLLNGWLLSGPRETGGRMKPPLTREKRMRKKKEKKTKRETLCLLDFFTQGLPGSPRWINCLFVPLRRPSPTAFAVLVWLSTLAVGGREGRFASALAQAALETKGEREFF